MDSRKRLRHIAFILSSISCGLVFSILLPPTGFVGNPLSRSAVGLIGFYQRSLRPLLGDHIRCRLHPTCSNYALEEFKNRSFAESLGAVGRRFVACARVTLPSGSAAGAHAGDLLQATLIQGRGGEEGAVACCAGFGFLVLFVVVALLALGIFLLVWVARDAKNRGVDNPVVWMVLVLITGIIGLVIYLAVRPSGNLVQCEHCPNKKLQYAKACPHCGQADTRAQAAP